MKKTNYHAIAAAANRHLEESGKWWRYSIDGTPQCKDCGYHAMLSGPWDDWPDSYYKLKRCPKCKNMYLPNSFRDSIIKTF